MTWPFQPPSPVFEPSGSRGGGASTAPPITAAGGLRTSSPVEVLRRGGIALPGKSRWDELPTLEDFRDRWAAEQSARTGIPERRLTSSYNMVRGAMHRYMVLPPAHLTPGRFRLADAFDGRAGVPEVVQRAAQLSDRNGGNIPDRSALLIPSMAWPKCYGGDLAKVISGEENPSIDWIGFRAGKIVAEVQLPTLLRTTESSGFLERCFVVQHLASEPLRQVDNLTLIIARGPSVTIHSTHPCTSTIRMAGEVPEWLLVGAIVVVAVIGAVATFGAGSLVVAAAGAALAAGELLAAAALVGAAALAGALVDILDEKLEEIRSSSALSEAERDQAVAWGESMKEILARDAAAAERGD